METLLAAFEEETSLLITGAGSSSLEVSSPSSNSPSSFSSSTSLVSASASGFSPFSE